jgi:RNA polymerase sigma-70 factor (ECF subfamily)
MDREKTDEELLAEFQQGDAGAFEQLLRRHRRAVYTFFVRMMGDRARAEDLAQEAFLRIVKGAAAWEQRARFQTWLYAIARNLCVDASRRDRFRRTESLDEKDDDEGRPLVDGVEGGGPMPDRGAASAQLRPILQRALSSLPPEQREVFVLREQVGLSFKEIAELSGVNENTVKSRMRYALLGLRKALAEEGVTAADAEVDATPGVRLGRA